MDIQAQEATPKPAPPLLFVEVGGESKKRSKQSRAHVAKVNRARQRDESLKFEKGQSLKRSSKPRNGSSQNAESQITVRRKAVQDRPLSTNRRWNSTPNIPRTVSPVFGAVDVASFSLENSVDAADIAHFTFNKIMNSWLDPALKPMWLAAFFQHPLVFHSLSYSCGILQDVSAGRPIQHSRLVHRLKTIQIVNKQLDDIDHVDPEPILLAITTLWRINMNDVIESRSTPLVFTPHRRSASWVALFGKLGGDDTHSGAMVELVNRVGGLNNFKTLPSLQETLALGDLLHSSANASKPLFPSIWNATIFVNALQPALLPLSSDVEGCGFAEQVRGGLPANTLATLQRLGMVDKLLDDFSLRDVSVAEDIMLATLGNAVQHELLSLRPWHALDEDDREGSPLVAYEVCRNTSIIYSNAVIFPMAPNAAWLEKLLGELRMLLERSNTTTWGEDMMPLLIWSMFIAGMAAFWTRHRAYFVARLRDTLVLAGLETWEEVKKMLKGFLWRDDACEHGAAILWGAVRLND